MVIKMLFLNTAKKKNDKHMLCLFIGSFTYLSFTKNEWGGCIDLLSHYTRTAHPHKEGQIIIKGYREINVWYKR